MDNLQAQQKLVTSAWIDDVDTVMTAIRGFTRRRRLQNDCRVVLFELSGDRDLHVNVTHNHHTASPAGWSGPGIVPDGFVHNRRFGRAESGEIADHIHTMVFAPRQRAAAPGRRRTQ